MTTRSLVEDALYGRRQDAPDGTCFSVNRAGIDLISSSDEVLPIIEKVIVDVAEPRLIIGHQDRPFRGLDYVLGAYLVICSKCCASRAVKFLEQRTAALQAEAISCLPIFFRIVDGKYNFGTPVATELMEYVRRQTGNRDERLRLTAGRVLAWFRQGDNQ